MNIVALAWLDTWEFAASLRPRVGGFRKSFDKGSGGDAPGHRRLPIRGMRDDGSWAYVRDAAKWPELKVMLSRLQRVATQVGQEIEFGEIALEMLMPGSTMPWVREASEYAEQYSRAHLALRTNPRAYFFCGEMALNMQPGWLNLIARTLPCSAINLGETPRIHLIADFRRKEQANAVETETIVGSSEADET